MSVAKETQKNGTNGLLSSSTPGVLMIVAFSIVYFADVLTRASAKFFWYDELFTVYLSRLNIHALWAAITGGADYNPPFFYLVTRASTHLFGENNLGVRVPEIAGYWIFSLCLYRFASRIAGFWAGAIALLLPMLTSAYYYAYEARPHGIVFGFCGLALVCWQSAETSNVRRRWAPAGFAAALFGALMVHCYAVVLLAPFACTEILQSIRTRSIRFDFWAAWLAPALLSLIVYVPLFRVYKQVQTTTNFANVALPGWSQVGHFYQSLWAPCMAIVALILIVLALDFCDRRIAFTNVLREELALAVFFLLLPVFGVVLGKFTHGPFFHRYFYTAVGGLAIIVALGAAPVHALRPRAAIVISALLAISILVNSGRLAFARLRGQGEKLREESAGFLLDTTPGQPLALRSLLLDTKSALPVAVVNPFDAIYLAYYAPQLQDRLYAVADSEANFTYFAFERLRRCCGVFAHPPVTADQFASAHDHYLVYGDGGTPDQITALASPGSCIEAMEFRNEHFLARVRRKKD